MSLLALYNLRAALNSGFGEEFRKFVCFQEVWVLVFGFFVVVVVVVVMGISNVQHVSRAAAEGLTAKFGDLCEPHELKYQARRARISQLASKSRQATKTFRQMRLREKTLVDEVKFSSTDEEAFVMSLIPLRAEPAAVIKLRRSQSLKMSRAGPASVKTYYTTGVTKKLLKMCRSSSTTKYISLSLI